MRASFASPPATRVLVLCSTIGLIACGPAGSDGSTKGSGGSGGTSAGSGGATAVGSGGNPGGGSASGGSGGSQPGTGGASTGGGPGSGGVASTGGNGTGTGGAPGSGGASGTGGGGAGRAGTGGAAVGGAGVGGRGGGGGRAGTGGTSGGGGAAPPTASGLPTPPGAGGMPKPSGTAGNITVINWAGFKGAVSYTFDDDNSSQIQHYAELQALKVPYTFYLWTGKSDATNSIWATAVKDGHELGNHTQSHQSAGTVQDINAATTFIMQKFSVQPWTMAAPNGAGVYTTLANGLFFINRGVNDNLIGPNDNSDPFTLPCYIPPTGAVASAFNSEVDSARSAGKWRVILVHGFTGGSDSAYQPVPFNEFISGVQHTISLGDMWIGTVVNVAAYWQGQKAFSKATTTMSGSDKTWTWTLPGHFPPGKYLRVTVPGGTVKQNGAALPWNDHGFYEIALDAGSVTVSP